jgi:hypothetical protein
LIHAGFHKTGTTSLQALFQTHAERLAAHGYAVYRGRHVAANHVELHAYAMRDDRRSPFKLTSGLTIDTAYRGAVAGEIAAFDAANPTKTLLFSAEGVSLLRHPDELARLADLLPAREVSFLFLRRDKDAWRESYRVQHAHLIGENPPSDDFTYLADDSWLLDFDARLDAFRAFFGADAIQIIDYDVAARRDSSIVPAVLAALGVGAAFADVDLSDFYLNRRD